MSDQTESQEAPQAERLSDFWQRMHSEGVDMEHVRQMMDRVAAEEAAATAKAARLYFGQEVGRRLSRLDFADRLNDITRQAYGVSAAVESVTEDSGGHFAAGVRQLSNDLADDLKRLAEAFDAERTIDFMAEKEREPVSGPALSLAFLECDAARQAIERHKGPDDLPEELADAESAALMALALCPCEAEDVPSKLRYLLAYHKKVFAFGWSDSGSPEIMAALDLHFGEDGITTRSLEQGR